MRRFLVLLVACLCSCSQAWFGGVEPLGPQKNLRRLFAPYDLMEMNGLATNYCENLLDKRVNLVSYTHLNFDIPSWDAWHLQFPDDNARLLEGLVYEDQYSPVVRLELIRRLAKGLMSARYPGTKAYYSFRHRNDGKTFLIFEDENTSKLRLSTWGDNVMGYLKVGFRLNQSGGCFNIDDFNYTDEPEGAGTTALARNETDKNGIVINKAGISRYWNESPFVFQRHFNKDDIKVDFAGKYWFSNEDKPLEFAFESPDAEMLDITLGDHMVLFGSTWKDAETFIQLPNRKTVFSSKADGDQIFDKVDFPYFVLRKDVNWTGPGYSLAILVIFDEQPVRMEALAQDGYNQINLSYPRKNNKAAGKVWLFPFDWINNKDMDYVFSNAESFLKTGKLMHNGFPSMQLQDSIPAGLAASAYLLTKYNEPLAQTSLLQAQRAVDALLFAERDGMRLEHRVFSEVRAAAWMIRTAKLLKDQRMIDKYLPWLDKVTQRMLSKESSYDGKGWVDGWRHFYALRSLWLAYEATGREDYFQAWERGLEVYDIDEKGIYRNGELIGAPGGASDTYFGSLPLGAWGHAGMLDKSKILLNLDVPSGGMGGSDPNIHLKDLWNDAGAGPWAQDDAQPNFIGYCLRGLNIPQKTKTFLPLASFPVYNAQGNITVTQEPLVDNPFLPHSRDKLRMVSGTPVRLYDVREISLLPGSETEKLHLLKDAGNLVDNARKFNRDDESLIYKFEVDNPAGAAFDLKCRGNSYTLEVSPDGERWYQRLNTWSPEAVWDSVDLSFLVGNSDELLKMMVITPPNDNHIIADHKGSQVHRDHCRYVSENGYFIYKLSLPEVVECHLELVTGNGYKVEISTDGSSWHQELNENDELTREGGRTADAAWLKIIDVTKYLNEDGSVYVKFSNNGNQRFYRDKNAFLRRMTAYGVFDSNDLYVRLGNCPYGPQEGFVLYNCKLRTWSSVSQN